MRSKTTSLSACILLLVLGALTPSPAGGASTGESVVPLRILSDAGEVRGTAVVVRREDRGGNAVFYLLTSSRLFQTPEGELDVRPVRVRLANGRTIEVKPSDVMLPRGSIVEVAVLGVETPALELAPKPIDYEAPSVGSVFVIAGLDEKGAPKTVAEHVRFESTLLAVGDRELSALTGCVGAPAISLSGVVGIVRECEPGRSPVISLLAMARPFIERFLPRVTFAPAIPQFRVVDREIAGPTFPLVDAAAKTGEVTVPFDLGPREAVVEATASIATAREVRFADVAVLKLEDRSVRLRFTVGGGAPLSNPGVPPPYGQALVTVHLRVAVLPNP